MKKFITYTLLSLATATTAFAQKDADAKTILNGVTAKYHTYTNVKADFTLSITDPQAGVKQVQSGTLVTQPKDDKFRMTMYSPDSKTEVAQELISDGKTQWTYLKKDKEVQVSNVDKSGEGMSPAKLFTMYEHGYKYVFTGTQSVGGKICQVIDLSPEDANNEFFKIRLYIDKAKKQIYTATVFDKGGARYAYTVNSFTVNAPVKDEVYTFDKKNFPGVEVVDLR